MSDAGFTADCEAGDIAMFITMVAKDSSSKGRRRMEVLVRRSGLA